MRKRLGGIVVVAALAGGLVGWLLYGRALSGTPDGVAQALADAGPRRAGALEDTGAGPTAATLPPDAEPLKAVPCELSTLLEEYRKGRASPSYRRYVREQLRGLVESLPAEPLWSRLLSERDPELLAVVAEAWVLRYTVSNDGAVVARLVEHLNQERDPRLRATLVRALAHTGEPSTELLGDRVLKGQDVYRDWVKDASSEVRAAAVENFREEAARNFGRFRGVAEKAVALAAVAEDPATAAGLLTATSIEAAGGAAVAKVRGLLQSSEHPEVRAAAARALSTSPVSELPESLDALAARYAAETDRSVKSALLESLSRLGLTKAVPVLQRLRETDPAMRAEVDGWLALLATRPQTWDLLDKARRARDAQAQRP
jgi:hypothetical protein